MEKYFCLDYLCMQQYKSSSNDKQFQDSKFDGLYGIGVPKVFMKIMSCHGFAKKENANVILTCRSKLVSYYLSKRFVITDRK